MGNGKLRGSFSVGGGPTQYKGYGSAKPKPVTTTTSSVRPTTTTSVSQQRRLSVQQQKPKVKKAPPSTTTTSVKPKGLFGTVRSRGKAKYDFEEY